MGLFSGIMRDVQRAVAQSVVDTTVKPKIEETIRGNLGVKSSNSDSYTISEKYNEFPRYSGNIIEGPTETNTTKYDRVTMKFSGSPSSEFKSLLSTNGFTKSTNVRYDKGNIYVIVEDNGSSTKIVYHIKK